MQSDICAALRNTEQEAGYDPDISKGTRRLNIGDSNDSDEEAPPAGAEAGAAVQDEAAPAATALAAEAQAEAPPPRRYGVVMREEAAAAGPAATSGAPAPPAAAVLEPPGSAPVAEVLRRVFTRDHPGVAAMAGWLEEEGVHTAAQLGALLARGGAQGGAAALRHVGFRPEWAAATAAGFARAADAAEQAASS